MDWQKLLSPERLGDPGYVETPTRPIFIQDHDRIVFSAPFRRLANKTQVHPLYDHDHIHHRLIHSVEVSSVGRSLAIAIGRWLADQGHIATGDEHSLGNIVQAASVAHDIGNPPFGHSGEASIGSWFATEFSRKSPLLDDIPNDLRHEFVEFEGNAQGFRILTRLEMYRNSGGMRLSKGTLGAFTKYPVSAAVKAAVTAERGADGNYVGLKKFGVFSTEQQIFSDVAETLGLIAHDSPQGRWWYRHPLVFIVEAADDICYNIVDLEDAFTSGDLPFEVVRDRLDAVCGKSNRDVSGYSQHEHIALLRALAIGAAVQACVEAFITHYDAIMAGTFSGSLIGVSAQGARFAEIGALSREHIFTSQRKTELELSGRQVVRNVMSGILPVYQDLARARWDRNALNGHSDQIARAFSLDLRDISSAAEALHAMADFVSGMTDRYALRLSRMLSGT